MNVRRAGVMELCAVLAISMIVMAACAEQKSEPTQVGMEQGAIGLSTACEALDIEAEQPAELAEEKGNGAGKRGNVDTDNGEGPVGVCDGDNCCHSHCDDNGCCHTHCHANTCIDGDCDTEGEQNQNRYQYQYQHRYRNCKGQHRWCHAHCHGDGYCHSHCHGHGCCYCKCQGEGNCHCYCRGCNDECDTDQEEDIDTLDGDSDGNENQPTDDDDGDEEDTGDSPIVV